MDAAPRETRLVASESSTDSDRLRRQSTLRQIEKRSRQRRAEQLRRMREELETLGRVHFVLPLLDDADTVWDDFLDDDLKHTRRYVRTLLPGAKDVERLLAERTLLTRLLKEHVLMARAILCCELEEKTSITPDHTWQQHVRRWRTLTRIHFRPWTMRQCEEEIERATNEMNRFILSNDRASSGMSFLGWQDSRRLDRNSSRVQFTLTKTFEGFDLSHYVATTWRIYTEAAVFSDVVLGGRAELWFEVLQELSPTCSLIRFTESYDHIARAVHGVYLVARTETDDGMVQFMRSVPVPELQRAISQTSDIWTFDFYWMRWDILDKTKPLASTDFRVTLGGTVAVEDVQYLHYWLVELLGAIVRSEQFSSGRRLLKNLGEM